MRLVLTFLFLATVAESAEPIYGPGSYPAGNYYLANDIIVESGVGLSFHATEVKDRAEVNLNGKTIRCLTDGDEYTVGIVGSGQSNLIIIGGGASWIDGCRVGVSSSRQTRVQEVVFTNIRYMAMDLSGPWSRVILNEVSWVTGVTDEAYSVGVNISGPNALVRGNRLTNFYRQPGASGVGEGVPIIINSAAVGAVVELNSIVNDSVAEDTIGIWAGAGGHTIRNNTVRGFHYGIQAGGPVYVYANTVALGVELDGAVGLSLDPLAVQSGNTVVGY